MGGGVSVYNKSNSPSHFLKSRSIDKRNRKDAETASEVKRLLLLGPGDSGKSTFLKQMIMLHGRGYSKVDRLSERESIRDVVASYIIDLANAPNSEAGRKILKAKFLPENERYVREINEYEAKYRPSAPLTADLVSMYQNLAKDPAYQKIMDNNHLFHLPYFAKHFFSRLDQIVADEYVPTEEDMIRVNVRSTGVHRIEFEVDGFTFEVVDVGGQRNERKKWVHFFEDTTAVLLVISISEFDQVIWEDNATPRVQESEDLCREISKIPYLKNASIIFFFNKTDLLCKKLQTKKLKDFMPDYQGSNEPMVVGEFFKNKFINAFQEESISKNRELFSHFTTAVDSENIRRVFADVRHSIIKAGLRSSGLM